MGFQNRRDVLGIVIEFRQVQFGKRLALLEQRIEIGSERRLRPLMPPDQFDAAQSRPELRDNLDGGGRSGVDGERGDLREGGAQAVGEEDGVGGGGGGRE